MFQLALSFDVEDWFQVRNMRELIGFHKWDSCRNRLSLGLDFILDRLYEQNIQATFFVLGWIAERYPELVLEIASRGHEVATHGYSHTPLDLMTRDEFHDDLALSIEILQRITQKKIEGFRAPSFSISKKNLWAFEVMHKLGIRYDSSIFPISHPDYGFKGFENYKHELHGVVEVPMSVVKLGPFQLPSPGGGYFRLYPFGLSKFLLRKQMEKSSCVLYFHPWEFDPGQPVVALPCLKHFRHYVGLDKNRDHFTELLKEFSFVTMRELAGIEIDPIPVSDGNYVWNS